jgi:signal transduction histidine kinase
MLGFGAIILITLLLAGSGFVLILREYQIRREINRVAELTLPLSGQVRSLEQLGATTQDVEEYIDRQAEELDLRVVLADARGNIFADTEETLVGRQLRIDSTARFGIQRRVRQATVAGPDGEITLMVSPAINPTPATVVGAVPSPATGPVPAAPPQGSSVGERFLGRPSAYVIALSVPRQTIATAWLELLPRLALAAVGALVLSVAIAWPLAASIARPLVGMTRAAEEIARGRLDQQIPVRGRDEVARLGRAFNRMAREVAASQRTLRDLMANVSHDLRTPLTSIQGFSQALTDGTLREAEEVVEAGKIINQEAARMSRLVDDLLFLAKMEAGQLPLQRSALDLDQLVAARVEAAGRRAAEAAIALSRQPSPTPPVFADRLRIEQVVDNLLDNALRYTPAGGVVTVRLAADGERPSQFVRLSVHNTGSYIPPEDLPRVFERFYQVDKARSAGGTGLGLAISREIVQAHGGRWGVESSREGGTAFWVSLPASQVDASFGGTLGGPGHHAEDPKAGTPVGSVGTSGR